MSRAQEITLISAVVIVLVGLEVKHLLTGGRNTTCAIYLEKLKNSPAYFPDVNVGQRGETETSIKTTIQMLIKNAEQYRADFERFTHFGNGECLTLFEYSFATNIANRVTDDERGGLDIPCVVKTWTDDRLKTIDAWLNTTVLAADQRHTLIALKGELKTVRSQCPR